MQVVRLVFFLFASTVCALHIDNQAMVTVQPNVLKNDTIAALMSLCNSPIARDYGNNETYLEIHPLSQFNKFDYSIGTILVRHVMPSLDAFAKVLADVQPLLDFDEEVSHVFLYEMYPLAQLRWHEDGGFRKAIVIFLNERWEKVWGGYYLWVNNTTIQGTFPVFNTAVIARNNPLHEVSLISVFAQPRVTVSVWVR